jgi:hypothetical protein
MNMRTVLLLLLVACDAGKKPAPTPPLPPAGSASIVTDAALSADAAVDAVTIVVPGGGSPPHGIAITWLVYPPSVPMKRDPEILEQPVTLEIMTAGKVHTKKLAPQFGGLQPYNQSACNGDAYPLQDGELAKLTFYEGGAGGYLVKRTGDTLVVYSWAQSDGLCGTVDKPVECPRNVKKVADVVAYKQASMGVDERIVEIDDKGARKPFDCSAR